MSNPTFRSGPISFKVDSDVKKFHLVAVSADGVAPAGATGAVFGAVTENGYAPAESGANNLAPTQPNIVAVHIGPATVPLTVAGGDASGIAQGAPIYQAADGEVTATAGTGPAIGVAARDGSGTTVKTVLLTPVAG